MSLDIQSYLDPSFQSPDSLQRDTLLTVSKNNYLYPDLHPAPPKKSSSSSKPLPSSLIWKVFIKNLTQAFPSKKESIGVTLKQKLSDPPPLTVQRANSFLQRLFTRAERSDPPSSLRELESFEKNIALTPLESFHLLSIGKRNQSYAYQASLKFEQLHKKFSFLGTPLSPEQVQVENDKIFQQVSEHPCLFDPERDLHDLLINALARLKGLEVEQMRQAVQFFESIEDTLPSPLPYLHLLIFDRLCTKGSFLSPERSQTQNESFSKNEILRAHDEIMPFFTAASIFQEGLTKPRRRMLQNQMFDHGLCLGICFEYCSKLFQIESFPLPNRLISCDSPVVISDSLTLHPLSINYELESRARFLTASYKIKKKLVFLKEEPFLPQKIYHLLKMSPFLLFPDQSLERLNFKSVESAPTLLKKAFSEHSDKKHAIMTIINDPQTATMHTLLIHNAAPFHILDPNTGISLLQSFEELTTAFMAQLSTIYPTYTEVAFEGFVPE